jgi:hypothetical protein
MVDNTDIRIEGIMYRYYQFYKRRITRSEAYEWLGNHAYSAARATTLSSRTYVISRCNNWLIERVKEVDRMREAQLRAWRLANWPVTAYFSAEHVALLNKR